MRTLNGSLMIYAVILVQIKRGLCEFSGEDGFARNPDQTFPAITRIALRPQARGVPVLDAPLVGVSVF